MVKVVVTLALTPSLTLVLFLWPKAPMLVFVRFCFFVMYAYIHVSSSFSVERDLKRSSY